MKLTFAVCGFAAFASIANAQTTTLGPLAVRLPASARTLAMADVGIASRDDDVIFYNPAQLVSARGTSVSAERMARDVRAGTMSTVLRFGSGGLGFGVNYLEYRAEYAVYPISRDDILEPAAGEPAGTSVDAVIGYAQVFHKFRVGTAAHYAADEVGFERYRNVLADFGVARDYGRYTAALSLQHLGAPIRQTGATIIPGGSVNPPMKATLGGGWSSIAGPLDLTATAAVSAVNEGHLSPAVGGEASWSWLSGYAISWRAGVRYPRGVADPKYTGGVGFVADRVSVDLAAEVLSNDRVGYRAGLRIR